MCPLRPVGQGEILLFDVPPPVKGVQEVICKPQRYGEGRKVRKGRKGKETKGRRERERKGGRKDKEENDFLPWRDSRQTGGFRAFLRALPPKGKHTYTREILNRNI